MPFSFLRFKFTDLSTLWRGTEPDMENPDDSDGSEDESFHVGGERLEDDEELRLHILGVNTYFTKFKPYPFDFRVDKNIMTKWPKHATKLPFIDIMTGLCGSGMSRRTLLRRSLVCQPGGSHQGASGSFFTRWTTPKYRYLDILIII